MIPAVFAVMYWLGTYAAVLAGGILIFAIAVYLDKGQ